MSHITKLDVQIRDLDALEIACRKIGLKFNRNQTQFRWYQGRISPCTHAIVVPGNAEAYEIGVNEVSSGIFELATDFHAGGHGLMGRSGFRGEKLIEAYAQTVAIKEATKIAQAEGYKVHVEEDTKTGETIITLRSL